MDNHDVRWKQRFENFLGSFEQLKSASLLRNERELSILENQGVIQSFEVTQELSWKVLKDFLEEKGNDKIYGSKDSIRLAFNAKLITNADVWMDMIKSRNAMSHTYDYEQMLETINIIFSKYIIEFENFKNTMQKF